MEWLKKLIEGAKKKDDGSIDIDDLMKSINTEFPKNAVPKETYNDVSGQLKTAQTTIKERDTQIEGLKKVDGEALQAKITELQDANKEAATKYQQELKELQISNAIKLAISDKAQDADLVSGLFDKSKLILGDDGKITGLDEQLKSLQESKAFLFKEEKSVDPKPQPGFKLGGNGGNSNQQPTETPSIKSALTAMFNTQQ